MDTGCGHPKCAICLRCEEEVGRHTWYGGTHLQPSICDECIRRATAGAIEAAQRWGGSYGGVCPKKK